MLREGSAAILLCGLGDPPQGKARHLGRSEDHRAGSLTFLAGVLEESAETAGQR
jgi:hypothetical protein